MTDSEGAEGQTRRGWSVVFAIVLGIIGILMVHHPMIFTGLRRVQADLGDSRLINYFLEHNYLWYRGDPLHRDFWNPPFFYPARNMAAYSDTMLGIAPVYAAFRGVGFAPDTAFQLWMIALSILNYGVMLHFARSRIKLSIPAASACAFLFAFGAPRVNMLAPQPQLPQFLSLITIDALFGLFSDREGPWLKRLALWLVATAGMFAQLSSGYYTGWFTIFSLGLAVLVAVWMPATRMPFLATVWRDAPWIAISGALGGLVMRPWLIHHLIASKELGTRYIGWITILRPHPSTWLHTGSHHWLGTLATQLTGFRGFAVSEHDTPIGVGLTTTLVGLAGLYLTRNRPSTRLLALVAAVLFLCITHLPGSLVSLATYLLILAPVTLLYSRRVEEPWAFFLVVAIVIMVLNTKVNPNDNLIGCGCFALLITIAAFLDANDDSRGRFVLAVLILALSYTLIQSIYIIGVGIVCGGVAAGASAWLGARSRSWLEAMVLGGFLLFAGLTSYGERPVVLLFGLGAPLVVLSKRLFPVQPPTRFLGKAAVLGLVMAVVFEGNGSAWNYLYFYLPGASSLLFVSRIGLMMLIPWAIGVGYSIDALLARKRPILALAVGLICLLEQGVTTSSFDKYANREVIASLARRIDQDHETFYYSPHHAEFAPFKANLDAMWAGLEAGKPTINGYSGHTPFGWRSLEDSNQSGPVDIERLEAALDAWRRRYGQSVTSVQWIIDPSERGSTAP